MPVVVSPTATNPTHHLKLSAGGTDIGLILRSGNRIDPRAITRRPRANGQYSPFTQSDWGSGRGIKDASSDRSRFSDSKRAITRHSGTVMLGGQETFTTGYRQQEQYMPGKVTWQSLLTTNRYIAYKFTAGASGNRGAIYLWIRRRGTPTSTLTVELCSDSAGPPDEPDAVLKTVTVTTATITDTISQLYEFAFSSVQAVVSANNYWIKIYTSSADTATDYWEVGTDAARTNAKTSASSNGTSWSGASHDLYFRIVDDTDLLGGFYFYYKSQVYFLTRPSGSAAPKLYENGFRGVATGTHSTTTLQDTTKAMAANAYVGAILLIISGTNSEWKIPYRTITSHTADTLTFSPAFPKAPVSADTVYVVLGSNYWNEIAGHGLTVLPTAVVSDGEVLYFAQGNTVKMRKMREYLSGSTWTRAFFEENNYADFLGVYRHQTQGLTVFKTQQEGNAGLPIFAQSKTIPWNQNTRLLFPYLLDDGEATTGWTFGANVTGSLDNTVFMTKAGSIKMIKAAGSATTTPFAYKAFSAGSINAYKGGRIRFWVQSTVALAAGGLKFRLSTATDCSTAVQDIDLPGINANEHTQIVVPYNDTVDNIWALSSFGFICASNATFWVDGVEIFPPGSEVVLGNKNEKINGVDVYGDPETPWIFRTQSAGSIENGVFVPIPLKELSNAENPHNGMGHTVHNVNLYFSFLHGLERFYRNNLDDVGPNRDEGLPADRRGFITSMAGYIGRFLYNYDVVAGYSSIMESTSGTDHHEAYRCDTPGKRIRNIFTQVIPGDTADRLWFTEGDDLVWLPLPGNTLKEDTDDTFRFTHEAVLESGWITGAQPDAVKIFSNLKLFMENVSSNRKIEWDYRTDDTETWTPSSSAFTSGSVQEITLNISAKRIKFRFRLQTNDNTLTPKIKQMFVGATTRPETRWTYTVNTCFDDGAIDLEGTESTGTRAETLIAQIDAWMEANTILTMRSVFATFDNKQVILEPAVLTPYVFIADESLEKLMSTLTLLEP